jgi:hypothetical protein
MRLKSCKEFHFTVNRLIGYTLTYFFQVMCFIYLILMRRESKFVPNDTTEMSTTNVAGRHVRRHTSNLLTEMSLSWGAANCAATQEPPSISWNPKVQYRVHMNPPLVPIPSCIKPIHSHYFRCRDIENPLNISLLRHSNPAEHDEGMMVITLSRCSACVGDGIQLTENCVPSHVLSVKVAYDWTLHEETSLIPSQLDVRSGSPI